MAPNERLDIRRSIDAAASPDRVMDAILRPSTWHVWQKEIVHAAGPEPLKPGDVAGGRAEMLGFNVDGQSVTTEVTETTYEQEVVVGVGMRIGYRLEPTGTGTRVTHQLEAGLPKGVLGAVLSFFLARRLKAMQKDLLEELKRYSETST